MNKKTEKGTHGRKYRDFSISEYLGFTDEEIAEIFEKHVQKSGC